MNKVTLSSGTEITLTPLGASEARELSMSLAKAQLMDANGEIVEATDIDDMPTGAQMRLVDGIMTIIDDILVDGVEVALPRNQTWAKKLYRKSYVRTRLEQLGVESLQELLSDADLKRYLYVRYVAIEGDDDYNLILNAALQLE